MKLLKYGIGFLLIFWSAQAQDIPKNEYGLAVIDNTPLYLETIEANNDNRLVDLEEFIPSVVIDVKYATTENFTGKQLYPYPGAYLRYPAAVALRNVQEELIEKGLGLKVWDAYRPYSATVLMWDYVRDPRYVADPRSGSRHNRGCAVDVTLIDLETGEELPMPTPYDDFTERAHIDYTDLPEEALQNRELLIDVMQRHGFEPLASEWWHFDYKNWREFDLMDVSFEVLETIME